MPSCMHAHSLARMHQRVRAHTRAWANAGVVPDDAGVHVGLSRLQGAAAQVPVDHEPQQARRRRAPRLVLGAARAQDHSLQRRPHHCAAVLVPPETAMHDGRGPASFSLPNACLPCFTLPCPFLLPARCHAPLRPPLPAFPTQGIRKRERAERGRVAHAGGVPGLGMRGCWHVLC